MVWPGDDAAHLAIVDASVPISCRCAHTHAHARDRQCCAV